MYHSTLGWSVIKKKQKKKKKKLVSHAQSGLTPKVVAAARLGGREGGKRGAEGSAGGAAKRVWLAGPAPPFSNLIIHKLISNLIIHILISNLIIKLLIIQN